MAAVRFGMEPWYSACDSPLLRAILIRGHDPLRGKCCGCVTESRTILNGYRKQNIYQCRGRWLDAATIYVPRDTRDSTCSSPKVRTICWSTMWEQRIEGFGMAAKTWQREGLIPRSQRSRMATRISA